jgi:hypothetical protein
MRCLPFPPETFDVVVSDPPWKIDLYHRHRPFYECVRVCKVGGTIIYNATWMPHSSDAELVETWVRSDGTYLTASVLSVFRKTQANPAYEAMIAGEKDGA